MQSTQPRPSLLADLFTQIADNAEFPPWVYMLRPRARDRDHHSQTEPTRAREPHLHDWIFLRRNARPFYLIFVPFIVQDRAKERELS